MHKFVITKQVVAGRKIAQIEIGKSEYDILKSAKHCLLNAIAVEDKFGYLVENYRELELELMREALDDMLFSRHEWGQGIDKLHRVSRRIINLLSTTCAYLDHSKHHLSEVFGKPSMQLTDFLNYNSELYNSSLSFRTIEALRNFVQHRALPIGMVTGGAKRVELNSAQFRMHTVSAMLRIQDINDKKFKQSVLSELQELGEVIDLKPLIDEYIELLRALHVKLRAIFLEKKVASANLISDAIERFEYSDGHRSPYVHIVELVGPDWIAKQSVTLLKDFSKRLDELEGRIAPNMRFTDQFATSLGKGVTTSK